MADAVSPVSSQSGVAIFAPRDLAFDPVPSKAGPGSGPDKLPEPDVNKMALLVQVPPDPAVIAVEDALNTLLPGLGELAQPSTKWTVNPDPAALTGALAVGDALTETLPVVGPGMFGESTTSDLMTMLVQLMDLMRRLEQQQASMVSRLKYDISTAGINQEQHAAMQDMGARISGALTRFGVAAAGAYQSFQAAGIKAKAHEENGSLMRDINGAKDKVVPAEAERLKEELSSALRVKLEQADKKQALGGLANASSTSVDALVSAPQEAASAATRANAKTTQLNADQLKSQEEALLALMRSFADMVARLLQVDASDKESKASMISAIAGNLRV